MRERAVMANVATKLRQRNEDFFRVGDELAVHEIAARSGSLHEPTEIALRLERVDFSGAEPGALCGALQKIERIHCANAAAPSICVCPNHSARQAPVFVLYRIRNPVRSCG